MDVRYAQLGQFETREKTIQLESIRVTIQTHPRRKGKERRRHDVTGVCGNVSRNREQTLLLKVINL